MKRTLLLPLVALALTSMACSLFTDTTVRKNSLPATQAAVMVPTSTNPPIPTAPEPTRPVPASTQVLSPTEPVPEPSATIPPTDIPAGPVEYVDSFDRNQGNWSDDFIVTTQTSGRDLASKALIQDGKLRFRFEDRETYMYKFFQTPVQGNVTIETSYLSIGHLNNGIAIACKVNDDRTSWFEVRVSSTSDFSIYLYDKQRKTEQGKNPYLQLGKGKFKIDELFPTKPNILKVTCLENQIILDTNQGKRTITQDLETSLEGRWVGLGAMSYDVIPITIEYDEVTIREE